jgi:hypothetical protein
MNRKHPPGAAKSVSARAYRSNRVVLALPPSRSQSRYRQSLHRLVCMSVSDMEQSSRHKNRKIDCDRGNQSSVIHVATVLGRGRGGNSLSIGWCNSEASKHRCKRDGQTAKLRFRFKQSRRTRLIVDPPFEQLTFRQLARICRINNVRRHNRGGITDGLVGKIRSSRTTNVSSGSAPSI